MKKVLLIAILLTGCPKNNEKPPCDAKSLAEIVATCKGQADCDKQIEEREKACGEKIKTEYQAWDGGSSIKVETTVDGGK